MSSTYTLAGSNGRDARKAVFKSNIARDTIRTAAHL